MKDSTMLLHELKNMSFFNKGDICLVGCPTSEVISEKIGTVGSMEVTGTISSVLDIVGKETGVTLAFQGCEHTNRAITIEKSQFNPLTVEEVSVVLDVHAGGSLTTYALQRMKGPIVVEHITVSCGIDIGQMLTGMHIKHVCAPVRTSVKQVGQAIVTIATSRSKKIGGERTKYQ